MKKRNGKQAYFPEEERDPEQELDQNITRKTKLIRQIRRDIIVKIAVFAAFFLAAFTFVFGVTKVETNDMFPAIHAGDVVVFYRLGSLVNTDVAVYECGGGIRAGRVQACPGSRVDRTEDSLLTIDGNLQPIQKRSGLYYKTYAREGGAMKYPSTVPEGAYLILGDERTHAKDARDYGYITREQIKGKVFTIIRRRPL